MSEAEELRLTKSRASEARRDAARAETARTSDVELDKRVPPSERSVAQERQAKLQERVDAALAAKPAPRPAPKPAVTVTLPAPSASEARRAPSVGSATGGAVAGAAVGGATSPASGAKAAPGTESSPASVGPAAPPSAPTPPATASGRDDAIAIQQEYWARHKEYVDPDGTVFAATFNPTTGKLLLERNEELESGPTPEARATAARQQVRLEERITAKQRAAQQAIADMPPQLRRAQEGTLPPKAERDAAIRSQLETEHDAANPLRVEADGTVSTARTDPTSGATVFEEQPSEINVQRLQEVELDGSRTRTNTARGDLSNGSETSTMVEHVDRAGVVSSTETTRRRETREGNASTVVEDEQAYDTTGTQTRSANTTTVDDAAAQRVTVATTADAFEAGVLANRKATVFVTGRGPHEGTTLTSHGATDTTFTPTGEPAFVHQTQETTIEGTTPGTGDDPDVKWWQSERTDTRIDGEGASIVDADGTLVVTPTSTLDRGSTTRVIGAGQDDGTDLVTVTRSRATSNDAGELVFGDVSSSNETIEGKDGDKGEAYETRIDPKTGQPVGDEAERLNVDHFDDRSGWRQFKDTTTKYAGIGAAVLGTALLFTGVGTVVGAGLLIGAAALGTTALVSTAADYATGRNHVSGADVALTAAMAIPGVGGGLARAGGGLAAAATIAGTTSRTASMLANSGRALDVAGKVMTAGYAGYETQRVGRKLASGEGVGTMDLLNLLSSYGGAKHTFVRPRASGTDGGTSTTAGGAPASRSLPHADVTPAPLRPEYDVIVGGAGPGGMTAALRSQAEGLDTVAIESRGAVGSRDNVVVVQGDVQSSLTDLAPTQGGVRGERAASLGSIENHLRASAAERGLPVHYNTAITGVRQLEQGGVEVDVTGPHGTVTTIRGKAYVDATGGRTLLSRGDAEPAIQNDDMTLRQLDPTQDEQRFAMSHYNDTGTFRGRDRVRVDGNDVGLFSFRNERDGTSVFADLSRRNGFDDLSPDQQRAVLLQAAEQAGLDPAKLRSVTNFASVDKGVRSAADRDIALVGDSVAWKSPYTGEGMNQAVRDGNTIGPALRAHVDGDTEALAAYGRSSVDTHYSIMGRRPERDDSTPEIDAAEANLVRLLGKLQVLPPTRQPYVTGASLKALLFSGIEVPNIKPVPPPPGS